MQFHLVVVRAFGAYARGDLITDPETIAAVLGSESANNVVRIVAQGG
jgi:hypothetical protein